MKKGIYKKSIVNIFKGEKIEYIPPKIRNKARYQLDFYSIL